MELQRSSASLTVGTMIPQAALVEDDWPWSAPAAVPRSPAPAPLLHDVTLAHPADFDGWRRAARRLLAAGVPPESVGWRVDEGQPSLFAPPAAATAEGDGACNVPRHFLRLAEQASLHADSGRFALLYRLLWRLSRGERSILLRMADRDVARVEAMAAAVRRCAHKLKAFLRFTEVRTGQGPHLIAWFEPEHHVLEGTAPFFARKHPTTRWSIVTPYRSAHWDGAKLRFGPGGRRRDVPAPTAPERAWRGYHALVSAAATGVAKASPTGQVVYLPSARERSAPAQRPPPTLAEARQAAEACRACALARRAACAVFGEGPPGAPVMLVGEQPGEADEAAGRPFAGAAGRLLDQALGEAGLDRGGLYVTHAVKHFKFARRGGQRVPLRPEPAEVAACRPWLDRERVLVRPHLIVALGAVAAAALLERPVSLPLERGRILPLEDGSRLLVTEHPSTILRLADRTAQGREYRRLVADLLLAVPYLRRAA